MKTILLLAILLGTPDSNGAGMISAKEVSIGGVEIGDSTKEVRSKLGKPKITGKSPDFLSLHYDYKHLRVSFSDDVVAGLFTESRRACTPKRLCPGDSLDKMRRIYGGPLVADRETGRFYEYIGVDLYCWLQIPAQGNTIVSIRVACQP